LAFFAFAVALLAVGLFALSAALPDTLPRIAHELKPH
jgi:hypothetical protein